MALPCPASLCWEQELRPWMTHPLPPVHRADGVTSLACLVQSGTLADWPLSVCDSQVPRAQDTGTGRGFNDRHLPPHTAAVSEILGMVGTMAAGGKGKCYLRHLQERLLSEQKGELGTTGPCPPCGGAAASSHASCVLCGCTWSHLGRAFVWMWPGHLDS